MAEPTSCMAFESGPCSICEERAAIRDQIKHLDDEVEIATLKAKHDSLASQMNAIHDPFIHKFPPEIGSHIFRLSLPILTHAEHLEASSFVKPCDGRISSAKILRLGGVCRMWRQLAWATPDLWHTLYLKTQGCSESLAKLLPDLVREWLKRSGNLPLTIFFHDYIRSEDDSVDSDDPVEVAIGSIIEIFNLHSRRWRFSGSIQPNQLVGLGLQLAYHTTDPSWQAPKFVMESEFAPTHLALDFPLTSINVRWDNVTHVTLFKISTGQCINILRQAPCLEYYSVHISRPFGVSFRKPILHPRLRSLRVSTGCDIEGFLEAINLPSVEDWAHRSMHNERLPVAAMLSVFQRSGCVLKVLCLSNLLHSEGLNTLLQAIPSLEYFTLSFRETRVNTMMDTIFARIFCPARSDSSTLDDPTHEPFLPRLKFMEFDADSHHAPFSWDKLPQLFRQGHQRPLVIRAIVEKLDITDEIAIQLLQLADEGLDLQIIELSMGRRNLLENFRARLSAQDSIP
ncbi:hypothetical protein M413DRAFT_30820 [Hebeloma cylindrosporum]|uniref:F-box domain-containing protein n=1 Tax=Hebeloma cylindrosporum TaxID=76867 RepID=A0A0C2XIL0_HEBCY|nr:hypothetical protein M413DRAFT_30820 [Hebeloma cylindrosporum h7]